MLFFCHKRFTHPGISPDVFLFDNTVIPYLYYLSGIHKRTILIGGEDYG